VAALSGSLVEVARRDSCESPGSIAQQTARSPDLRRKVPSVDGALTVHPRTRSVPPARNASASSMQSPPASAEETSVAILSPVFALPVRRRGRGDGRRAPAGRDVRRAWPAAAGPRGPPGGRRRRRWRAAWGCSVIASNGCSLFPVNDCLHTILPDSAEHPIPSSRVCSHALLRCIRVNGQERRVSHCRVVMPQGDDSAARSLPVGMGMMSDRVDAQGTPTPRTREDRGRICSTGCGVRRGAAHRGRRGFG